MVGDLDLLKEATKFLLARRSVFGVPPALGEKDTDIAMAIMVIMLASRLWVIRIDEKVDVLGFWHDRGWRLVQDGAHLGRSSKNNSVEDEPVD